MVHVGTVIPRCQDRVTYGELTSDPAVQQSLGETELKEAIAAPWWRRAMDGDHGWIAGETWLEHPP